MEDIWIDHIQKVDSPVAKVMEKCLTNPIVVKKILRHFSNRQLLDKLSLVNKMWSYEARKLMQKRGNLFATFKCRTAYEGCNKFKDFELGLQRMNVIPFDGIRFKLNFHGQNNRTTKDWESNFEATLERLNVKHISLDLDGSWWDHKDCQILLFLKRVFQRFSPVLETLRLDIEDKEEAFIPTIIQHPSFPCLKIIQLRFRPRTRTNLVKALVSRASNLQELHAQCPENDLNPMGQLLEGSSAVLTYGGLISAPFDEISDIVIRALRLKAVRLEYTGLEFNFERFTRIAPILLQVCCTTTLRTMTVDAVLAVPLMTYGVCLQNVNRLQMIINYELSQPGILTILKDFDFAHIFPSLEKVEVTRSRPQPELEPGHMNGIIGEANAVLSEPRPDRAVNIKNLELNVTLSQSSSQFFAQMFPKVYDLCITDYSEAIPFVSIWEHWQDMRKIEVLGKFAGNLDSVFCGIFPEEVAELEQMDEEYLEKVNIVPVMPAVTSLSNLQYLTLFLELSPLQDPTISFSNVTRLVAFKKFHGLSVSVSLRTKRDSYRKNQSWHS